MHDLINNYKQIKRDKIRKRLLGDKMDISVRTRFPEIFSIFLSSFNVLYGQEGFFDNLTVYIDFCDETELDELRFQVYVDMLTHGNVRGTPKSIVKVGRVPNEGIYTNMLWQSVKGKENVISFDDDIFWYRPGFFNDVINNIPDKSIFGYKHEYYEHFNGHGVASFAFGTKGIPFKEEDFLTDEETRSEKGLDYHQGLDSFKLAYHYPNNIHYIGDDNGYYQYFHHAYETSVFLTESENYAKYIDKIKK